MSLQTAYTAVKDRDLKPKIDNNNQESLARASLVEYNNLTREIIEGLLDRKSELINLSINAGLQLETEANLQYIKMQLQEIAVINKCLTLIYTGTYGK